jgi:hypothetical protein
LTVNNGITNNGLFILSNGSQLDGVTAFTNNGTLDVITDRTFTPPNGFANNGTILDAQVVKPNSVQRAGTTFTVSIDSYTGHTYRLQQSTTSPADGSFVDRSGVPAQQGKSGTVLSFTDANVPNAHAFYRIVVNP